MESEGGGEEEGGIDLEAEVLLRTNDQKGPLLLPLLLLPLLGTTNHNHYRQEASRRPLSPSPPPSLHP